MSKVGCSLCLMGFILHLLVLFKVADYVYLVVGAVIFLIGVSFMIIAEARGR